MGNTLGRAHARLRSARRRLTVGTAAGIGLTLVAPVLAAAPAQAGLVSDLTGGVSEVASGIPIVGDVTEPLTDLLDDAPLDELLDGDELLDTSTGLVTDPAGTVTKIVDLESGVVTNASDELLGILDPVTGELLLPPVPGIEEGAGTLLAVVDGVLTEVCTSADAVCAQLPLDKMVDEAAVVLKAVPASPGDVPSWEGCPEIIADICLITVDDLTADTPLAPIVSFLTGTGNPDAPDTVITSAPPGKSSKAHTFRFEADPESDETEFLCKLEVAHKSTPPSGAQRAHDWQPCGADPAGAMSYKNLANGTYVFAVQATEGELADETPATQSWTTAVAPDVPDTRITAGPKRGSWLFARRATFRFSSTVAGSEFQCDYDTMTAACDDGSFVWRPRTDGAPLRPGTHVFKVAALANKTQDFSPAVRAFHVPLDDRAMNGNGWHRKKQKGHFRATYTETTRQGASLVTKRKQKFRRVVLIADKGRGFGTVKVYWGDRMLKKVSLHAKKPLLKRKVIAVKRFDGKLRAGKIRVVVASSGKPVRIDGIGLAKR